MNKGLIVIGHDSSVFTTELAQISPEQRICILTSWPGHITWLVPNVRFPEWITGSFEKVAIRVPQHLQARQLAQGFGGPIVSTSANVSGEPPITSEHRARIAFADAVDAILSGEVGNVSGPSTICDAASGEFLR